MRILKLIGLLGLGIAMGAGAGAALWYSPGAAAPPPSAAGTHASSITAAPAPVVDAPAPEFSLVGLDGRAVNLSDWRGGMVILNFWATWCEPCKEELPLLNRVALSRPEPVTVLAVDAGEAEGTVRAFVDPLDLTSIRILFDPAGQVRDLYLVRGFPTTFFIDSAGVIRRIRIGTLSSSDIETILNQMGAAS